MASAFEEKQREIPYIQDNQLVPAVEDVLKNKPTDEKIESVEVQLNIQGYENRKDPYMTKDLVFPNPIKAKPSLCVIGGNQYKAEAERLGVPFYAVEETSGVENKAAREKIVDEYRDFILGKDFAKAFNLRDILKKRKKTHYMCEDPSELQATYEKVLKTYRLKVRDWNTVSFLAGNTAMPTEKIIENIKFGVKFLSSHLKKGPQNISKLFVKRTLGKPVIPE